MGEEGHNRQETSKTGRHRNSAGRDWSVRADRKKKRPQSLHEKLWVLAVCDSMKIVDVPEEGRRCFILREAGPERRRRRRNKRVRQSRKNVLKCKSERHKLRKRSRLKGCLKIKRLWDSYTLSAVVILICQQVLLWPVKILTLYVFDWFCHFASWQIHTQTDLLKKQTVMSPYCTKLLYDAPKLCAKRFHCFS